MTPITPDTLRTMVEGPADKVAELQARFDRHIHPVAGDDIEMTAGPVWEGVEPMRCAECNCKYGDSDCNWIATPRMTATTEAAPTGAMTDDEIVAKVMASRIDRNLADLFCDVIRLTRASDRAAMQVAVEALADPVAVHANMLCGAIAKPSWENIKHLYSADLATEIQGAMSNYDRDQYAKKVAQKEKDFPNGF